jgi:hypothetical protein
VAVATERVYAPDAQGIMRLIAAPGDPVPDPGTVTAYGIVTPPDDPAAAVPPLGGYDSMTEADILAEMRILPETQNALIRRYEQAHMARGSITTFGLRSSVVRGGRDQSPVTVPAESAAISGGYVGMSSEALDAELARRQITLGSGTGAGGAILKADKVAALQDYDADIDKT